jgi:xanthine phosphoribosyltransferase
VIDPTSQKFFPVSWDEFYRNAKALAWRLNDYGPWRGVIAVTRGGMVPACIVARELGITVVETVSVVGYEPDDMNPRRLPETKIVKHAANVGDGEGWLIVDDLVDTGRTVDLLRKLMPKAHYAAVYAKPLGKPLIDTFVTEVSQNTWIHFPWEVEAEAAKTNNTP